MNDPTLLNAVQALYAAFGRGDLPALLAGLDPAVQWRFIGAPGLPYTASVQGHEAVQRWFAAVADCDDIQAFEPREFLAGTDHVTVLGWERTVARRTGRRFDSDWVHIWQFRGGRVTRFLGLYDTAAAARAYAAD